MNILKVTASVILIILALKALFFILGLASMLFTLLFWAAIIYIVGSLIFKLFFKKDKK